MKRNRTRQIKSKKGGARVRQTARKSTAGKAPRMSLTIAPAVRTENENNGYTSNYRNNASFLNRIAVNRNNGNNKRNENSGTNEKDLRIKELEEKLNAIHDMSRV